MKIKDIFKLEIKSVAPQRDVHYHLYSLPSFDENKTREEVNGQDIMSNKLVVPDKCILFNKLNVRFKRVWKIDDQDDNKLASTEFLPLVVNEQLVDFNFAYFLLISDSLTDYLCGQNSNTSGSHKRIDPNVLLNMDIILPNRSEQERIGSFLSEIDDKIALNREINRNLEAMARQLYDYWFVQFDFPDENGKPYKSSGGKMVWNEKIKREIPEGWKIVSLPTIATFTNGLACQKFRPKSEDEKLPVIKIREMRDGITSESEWVAADIPDAVKVYDGDILFSWSASLEVMIWTGGEGGLNQHIFKVEPKSYYPKAFVYIQILDYISVFKGIAEARKTTMGHITQDHLNQSQIVIPASKSILQAFENTISPIVNLFVKLSQQSKQLMRQRDKLLPLLMNGQVSVMPREINCDLSHG